MTNAVTPHLRRHRERHAAGRAGRLELRRHAAASAASRRPTRLAFARPPASGRRRWTRTERIREWLHLALGKRALAAVRARVYLDFPGQLVAATHSGGRGAPALGWRPRSPGPTPIPAAIERIADLLAEAERPLILVGKGAAWADAGRGARSASSTWGIPLRGVADGPRRRAATIDPHFVNAARSAALEGSRRDRDDRRPLQLDLRIRARRVSPPMCASPRSTSSPRRSAAGAERRRSASSPTPPWPRTQLCDALDGRALAQRRAPAGSPSLREQRERQRGRSWRSSLADDAAFRSIPTAWCARCATPLPRDAIVSVDGETIMGICRAILPSYGARARLNAGTTGCMGTGVPYALGAKLARPERPSLAVLGDYAFGAAAMVVETAARVEPAPSSWSPTTRASPGHLLQDHMLPPGSPRIAALLPAQLREDRRDGRRPRRARRASRRDPSRPRAGAGRRARGGRARARGSEGAPPLGRRTTCARAAKESRDGHAPRRNPRDRLDDLAAGSRVFDDAGRPRSRGHQDRGARHGGSRPLPREPGRGEPGGAPELLLRGQQPQQEEPRPGSRSSPRRRRCSASSWPAPTSSSRTSARASPSGWGSATPASGSTTRS